MPTTNKQTICKMNQKVEIILHEFVTARNCDIVLYKEYLKKFHIGAVKYSGNHNKDYLDMSFLATVPFDSITRCRRLIQADLKFLPTDENVRRTRKMKEHVMREFVNDHKLSVSHP